MRRYQLRAALLWAILELLTNPMYHWKYDIMKKRAVGGWECN